MSYIDIYNISQIFLPIYRYAKRPINDSSRGGVFKKLGGGGIPLPRINPVGSLSCEILGYAFTHLTIYSLPFYSKTSIIHTSIFQNTC